ncbi:zinc finger MYND domain-containing protein [Microdochium nivale]|nr:zinc finger MYND domain-containing protein [Microdochium nivale]
MAAPPITITTTTITTTTTTSEIMADAQDASRGGSGASTSSTANGGDPPQQATSSSSSLPAPASCAHCAKPETSPDPEDSPALRPCTACKTALYCSRECKKADAKKHKKACAELAQEWHATHTVKMVASSGARKAPGEGHRGLQKWQFDT